ncbi:hypothetical protein PGTUg99_017188 [Puccinia graminis f. sp. tritici]|uniref:Uncharacterized protein n=1 Tax=Puccinia graminis f. sp. tritici TaxID=56615 RepID=A0A5B0RYU4_PUCGR|nr:hypothetical protein PGTUg99_017188 [Puccinia graminis f. sp. tritici]
MILVDFAAFVIPLNTPRRDHHAIAGVAGIIVAELAVEDIQHPLRPCLSVAQWPPAKHPTTFPHPSKSQPV